MSTGTSIRRLRQGAECARAPLEKRLVRKHHRCWYHMGRMRMWAGVQTAEDMYRAEVRFLPQMSVHVAGTYLNLPGGDYDDAHVAGLFTAHARMYPGGIESPRSVIHHQYMYVPIMAAMAAAAVDAACELGHPLAALVDRIFASHPAPGAVWCATGQVWPRSAVPVDPVPTIGAARLRDTLAGLGVRLPQLPPRATEAPGEGLRYARDVVVALHGVLLGAASAGAFTTDRSDQRLHAPGLQWSPSVVLLAADIPGTAAVADYVVRAARASCIRAAMQCVWPTCLALTYREFVHKHPAIARAELQSVVDMARRCWVEMHGYTARGELPPPLVARLEAAGVLFD